MSFLYINSVLIDEKEAVISVKDRGFRLGDGLFETIAIYDSIPYQWELHENRLLQGLHALKIPADISNIYENSLKLISKNGVKDGVLRISITRGIGGSGHLPGEDNIPSVVMETLPRPAKPDQPVSLWLSSWKKTPKEVLPVNIKSMQGLNSTLARMEADENDCFEALQLGIDGQVCECSSSNIFWISDGVLYTPSLQCGILDGTTRNAVIRISPLPVREGLFYLEDLQNADEVFITNTSWQVLEVWEVKNLGAKFTAHQKTKKIQDLLIEDIKKYVAERKAAVG